MTNDHPRNADINSFHRGPRDRNSGQHLLGLGARFFFIASSCAVMVASLIGALHVLYSFHVSHFAVIYVLTLATVVTFPDRGVLKAFWSLLGFVRPLGGARVVMRHTVEIDFLDWIADISGILGGLVPVVVQGLPEIQAKGR